MKNYLITIKLLMPYPKEFSYRTQATNIATAVARGLRELRKELKGRRLNGEITIKAIKL